MSVFELTMFPATEGDCLLVTWGTDRAKLRHILVDGGRGGTWKHLQPALRSIADDGGTLELLVLTHIDADHVDGLNRMMEQEPPLVPQRVWFNGYNQLRRLLPPGGFRPSGFAGADRYSEALKRMGWDVNAEFDGEPVMIETFPQAFHIEGLSITLLSPDRGKLAPLMAEWEEWRAGQDDAGTGRQESEVEARFGPLGKRPMPDVLDVEKLSQPSPPDNSTPNGSSIAMVAEYDGRRVLLAADAHPDLLEEGLATLAAADGGRCRLNLLKLSHHGSRANLTQEMLDKLECSNFAISTNGSRFGHPDPEAIARLLRYGGEKHKTLFFNYASERTSPWDDDKLRERWSYDCVFPEEPDYPLVVPI